MVYRVVVTGLGAITPLGLDVPTTWQAVTEGRSGAGRITLFEPSALKSQIAAEVKDYDPMKYFEAKEARRLDRFVQFALIAARQALQDSGLRIDETIADRVGVVFGTGIGGVGTLLKEYDVMLTKGPNRVSPFFVPMMLSDTAPGLIAINHGCKGPNVSVSSACASSANALGEAFSMIKYGRADAIIAGGAEAGILPLSLAGFAIMQALTTRNDDAEHASRPFDADRDGFLAAEGGGALVLENLDHARGRGAHIYGEIVGYGATADAFHITAPEESGQGAIRAMRIALQEGGIPPSEVGYLNAHGTSTPLNDAMETKAIKAVFGDGAWNLPISSSKSMLGHLLGAAGAVEAIICLKTLQTGTITPTINYSKPDPACDLDYTPNKARQGNVRYALSNSFGFGGHNAALLFKAADS